MINHHTYGHSEQIQIVSKCLKSSKIQHKEDDYIIQKYEMSERVC